MNAAVRRVVAAAEAAGLPIEVREFPEGTRTAADAAAAIGCDVAQIVKSLVFVCGDEPVVAYVSGASRLDAAKLEGVAGAPARRASATEAKEATGYAIGGTPPFGHARPLRTFMDSALLRFDEVWAAAGTPTTVWPVSPDALATVSGALVADIAEAG